MKRTLVSMAAMASVAGCVTAPEPYDYASFRAHNPRSILVVPVVNESVNADAADYFLSTVAQPFAERGYYVFPAHMVRRTLQDDGLGDASLVHSADATRMGNLFGCESVLYITIRRWQSSYAVITATTTVDFHYKLKSCETGDLLWQHQQVMSYTPQAANTGNPITQLIAQAVVSAIEKAKPNYMPLARQANLFASSAQGRGLPAGPYQAALHGKDGDKFPSGRGLPPNREINAPIAEEAKKEAK